MDLAHALVGRCHIDPDEGLVANLQTIADVVSFLATGSWHAGVPVRSHRRFAVTH